ncbi:hypothetical protein [Candidatus Enterococcus courvalinii]|uniref:Beta-1,6-galactofuranosyltransferase n=1 Tax=Candidatus Enterococcus courvalinii TaxID=2815329 RepID=A0ABS3HX15_9ENTE|nr:hypothetical protein [Enterococcus sp. MSG2901]MBO0481014.1 hypothetical protein [Enterococcus sp. MSG2901]
MQKNFFKLYDGVFNNAGGKAKQDAEFLFEKRGYQNRLHLPSRVYQNLYLNTLFTPVISLFGLLKSKKRSTYIFHYPTFFLRGVFLLHIFEGVNRWRKNKKIVLIHDIEELRKEVLNDKKTNFVTKFSRIAYLKQADVVIVHNKMMKNWLIKQGLPADKLLTLELFDYLTESSHSGGEFGNQVIMAGNLDSKKVQALEKIDQLVGIQFNLYGSALAKRISDYENVTYFGSYPADQIANVMKGSYGLVWDSRDFTGGNGAYANYQRYNSPHKVSLYLAAGFPVIVWKEAAIASFIIENKLGLVIEDLNELPEKIASVTETEYQHMKEKIQVVSEQIRSGYYLTQALRVAEKMIGVENNEI